MYKWTRVMLLGGVVVALALLACPVQACRSRCLQRRGPHRRQRLDDGRFFRPRRPTM